MKKRKTILTVVCIAAVLLAVLCGCREAGASGAPTLDKDASFLRDFEIVDDSVVFPCHLVLRNPGAEPVTVEIFGDFSDDVKSGLITESPLPALSEADPAISRFVLEPGETRLEVRFAAPHGTATEKQDRLPPAIEIVPVND